MIIESGVIIFIGLLLIALKLPTKQLLILLGYPLTVDVTVSFVAYILHWGTFSGVMSAAVAGLMTSSLTSCARYSIGYIEGGKYHAGVIWKLDTSKM